ncbi:MAG: site-specific DNA-methyltransferase, partial [Synergistaceae bacterium]|nr:site-specific DNA-methyltransferase [Synergistaceae bacterium]
PPYNTGHDFIYRDDFSQSELESQKEFSLFDDEGSRNFSLRNYRENSKSNPRFHSDWLSMIYPRLKLARNLLADDGVIFISIDDNEAANLRKICDEIFGESNFLASIIIVSNPGGRDYKQIAVMHETLLVYGQSEAVLHEIEREGLFVMADDNGGYELRELRNRNPKFNRENRPNLFFPIYVAPDKVDMYGCCAVSLNKDDVYHIEVYPYNSTGVASVWRWGRAKVANNIAELITSSNLVARQKKDGKYNIYEKCRKTTSKAKSIWDETEMRNEDGTRLMGALFGKSVFDHPKPLAILRRCLELATDDDSIILDFFAGSSTTAHAVMQLNHEDGGTRKFIMIQLPEKCSESSEAFKAGYRNICEIGRERIKRAGESLSGDTGFRVLKVASSNYRNVYFTPEELKQDMLDDLIENIKPDRTGLDLLFGTLAELGLPLTQEFACEEVNGFTVYYYGDDVKKIIACFDRDINAELVKSIAGQKPMVALFRDSCFEDSNAMINLEQIFRHYAPESELRIL